MSNKWVCQRCGEVHPSNPSECDDCGHTVLQQQRPDDTTRSRTIAAGADDANQPETISNAKEVGDMPPPPDRDPDAERTGSSGWLWLLALFILGSGLLISIQYLL